MPHCRTTALPRILLTIFLLLPALLNPTQPAGAAGTWYVSPSGSDAHGCASPSQSCASIDGAIAKAAAGDTIRAASGSYTNDQENIVNLSKNITLSGGWDSTFTTQSGYSVFERPILTGNYPHTAVGIYIPEGVTAVVERVTVQNMRGEDFACGVHNRGNLTLKDSNMFHNNNSKGSGGGVSNAGEMIITGCTIAHNYSYYGGGGVSNQYAVGKTMVIENSLIRDNSSYDSAGVYNGLYSTLTIKNSTITRNKAIGITGGGGIGNRNKLELIDSLVSENYSEAYGGGMYSYGETTILRSTIRDNESLWQGGGIFSQAPLILQHSLILNNRSGKEGGGLKNIVSAEISNSTFQGNFSSTSGGAIANESQVTLINSTLSLNECKNAGGAIFNNRISMPTAPVDIYNSTISHNKGGTTGGIANPDGATTLYNTLVAENTGAPSPDCSGTIQSAGYNLIGNHSACYFTPGTGDLVLKPPQLLLLVETLGHNPLQPGSPAIDAGNPDGCVDPSGEPLAADQRGAPRQGRCDIGAYEYTTPGAPAEILALQGHPQKAGLNASFVTPLQVMVLDALGSPIPDQAVTFTAPASGASAVFQDTATSATVASTGENGKTGLIHLRANHLTGDYAIQARAGDSAQKDFAITNQGRAYLPCTNLYYCADYFSDFDNFNAGWPLGENESMRLALQDGEYSLLMKQAGTMYIITAPTCLHNDFEVQVDVHWGSKTGSSYGLMFGMQNNYQRFYVLEVDTYYQKYWLYRVEGNSVTTILPPTAAYGVIYPSQATNTLKIERQGDQIRLWINGSGRGVWTDNGIRGLSAVGILASTYANYPWAEARFDHFTLTSYTAETIPTASVAPAPAAPFAAPSGGLTLTRLPDFGSNPRFAPAILQMPAINHPFSSPER